MLILFMGLVLHFISKFPAHGEQHGRVARIDEVVDLYRDECENADCSEYRDDSSKVGSFREFIWYFFENIQFSDFVPKGHRKQL